jgi:CRISPR-associated protein Cas1
MAGGRIVEIATDGRHLSVHRGFMVVTADKAEIARIPLDDISAVIANAHGMTYSNNLLVELATRGAMMVLCGPNHSPAAFLWATDGHHLQSARIQAQLASALPKSKQLWKQIVQAKITQQAGILEATGQSGVTVMALVAQVRSGDSENTEAQAARRYWPLLFGAAFRRDQGANGVNALLNYGYTVLRATVARAIMAAGLHPSIGLHHANQFNPMCLADDLMEPFRPFVDLAVFRLLKAGAEDVAPDTKKELAAVMDMEVAMEQGATAMKTAIQDMASSLGLVFEGKAAKLALPVAQPPLWHAQV